MAGKIILVTGGSRSGKSVFAEQYAASLSNNIGYIATAEILDEEMEHRVQLHRNRRPAAWKTVEAPHEAHKAIKLLANTSQVILFDCITMYVSNLLLNQTLPDTESKFQSVMVAIENLIESSKNNAATVIFVTNEVGAGIVPENALAREYRDIVGAVNQKLAAAADDVFWVVCGIPVNIKRLGQSVCKV